MTLFKTVKEINSKTGELHFRRWALIETERFSIYVHTIYRADEDRHLHNHPWDYTSIVLSGKFLESAKDGDGSKVFALGPGSIVRNKAHRFHKILHLVSKKVITLFITGRRKNPMWGYDVDGEFVNNVHYRILRMPGNSQKMALISELSKLFTYEEKVAVVESKGFTVEEIETYEIKPAYHNRVDHATFHITIAYKDRPSDKILQRSEQDLRPYWLDTVVQEIIKHNVKYLITQG